MRVSEAEIDRAIIARAPDSLYRFIRLAWPHVESVEYRDNWHIPLICEHLQAVSSGEIKRLVINVPPGAMKSLTCSVFWPVWEWINRPETKWMFASFDSSLVGTIQGGKVIDLLQSQWFVERWGQLLREEAPATSMFSTAEGGFRFATSPGGKGTGRHVDIQVIDDPNKPQDVQGTRAVTQTAIQATSTWFRGTASTRSVDAATFRRVILMQRLHEDDLAGEMLREGGWTHLCLPMRYERTTVCPCLDADCTPGDPRTEDGELLWPERFPEEVVSHMETVGMGPAISAAQYQQRPSPASGGIFQRSWFRYWHHNLNEDAPQEDGWPCAQEYCSQLPDDGVWFQSWDLTFKGTDGTDFVAGGVWLYRHPDFYLVDLVNARLSFVETCEAMIQLSQRYPQAWDKLVEDKANGPGIASVLAKDVGGIDLVNPQGGKESRAHAISGLVKAGHLHIPHPDLAPWVHAYRTQMVSFPKGVNDDMVDQTTQALLRHKQSFVPYERALEMVLSQANGRAVT